MSERTKNIVTVLGVVAFVVVLAAVLFGPNLLFPTNEDREAADYRLLSHTVGQDPYIEEFRYSSQRATFHCLWRRSGLAAGLWCEKVELTDR